MDEHRCYHEGDIAELKANMNAAFQRIDEQRAQGEALVKLTDTTHSLAITVATMTEKLETIIKTVYKVEASVARLETAPVEEYKRYKRSWISGTVMVIISMIVGALLQVVLV